jgi:flagellar biosynthesis/type III secretory pathway protein FliH
VDVDASYLLTGLIAVGIGLMPFYNAFAQRARDKKEESDQFHARINHENQKNHENECRIDRLEGYNEGKKDGRKEAREEMNL